MKQLSYEKTTVKNLCELIREGVYFRRIFSSDIFIFPSILVRDECIFIDNQPLSNLEYSTDEGKHWFKFK
jgi:hypothetical protein